MAAQAKPSEASQFHIEFIDPQAESAPQQPPQQPPKPENAPKFGV